ncbi:MAG: transcriptional repressor LexA [Acidobacteria bacterium]|nr:transcriptional repressor LexA [Acidobacteriota bacterium]MBI3279480.1 transcriptional repressor LexA [Acidobacteriota bacterium]
MALTQRQKEVLDFVVDFIDENGYSPSYEEIGRGLNLASLATVHKHITALQQRNYLRRSHNQSRSVDVSPKYVEERRNARAATPPPALELPLLGRIAAGSPVEAVAGDQKLNFADFVGHEGTYALQVRGDSMIEDHICSGDFVLVERSAEVRDGDIVVALVNGSETTLKRFYRESEDTVRLQPANAAMQPIRVPAGALEVQGRVLAVLRKFK